MVPLYITTKDKEFGHEDFVDYLTDLCRQHKEQGRALAFAFLAYDFEDNTITQMLKNKDYWATLDKISGKYLSAHVGVFERDIGMARKRGARERGLARLARPRQHHDWKNRARGAAGDVRRGEATSLHFQY